MWSDEEIKGKILHKLTRLGKFKHSHTSLDNMQKGFPKDLRGRVKTLAEKLKKEGILFEKPTGYGKEISINTAKREKIMKYIETFLEKE